MSDVNARNCGVDGIAKHIFPQRALVCVVLLACAQLTVWTIVPYLSGTSLPLDVVSDGLAWGHEWQWGYYKHPPLPSWEVEAFFDAFGDIGPYLLSQITVSLTYIFVFLLGRELMEAKWAAAGSALTAWVYYFSIPTPEFNHNVAQMPLWAAAIYAYWKAIHGSTVRQWFILGIIGGVAILTKYASGLLLLLMAIHVIASRNQRTLLRTPGPYAALAACLIVFSPHLVWLYQNHFPTLSYAVRRAGQNRGLGLRLAGPARFLLSQLLDISPALAAAAASGFLGSHLFSRNVDEKLRFLFVFGLGPAMLAAVLSLLSGAGLRDMWGAPMWSLTGLLIVYAARGGWQNASIPRLTAAVALAFVLNPIGYVLATNTVPALQAKPSRTQWPDRTMTDALRSVWYRQVGRPLRIIAADGWLGGLVAMRSPERPSVFTDGDFRKAPWITPDRLANEGALVLWRGDSLGPPNFLRLQNIRVTGRMTFAWPGATKAKPLVIGWGAVFPRRGQEGDKR